MVKFKKIASSLPKPIPEPASSSDSEASIPADTKRRSGSARHVVTSSVLEFIERFPEKYKISENLCPDGLSFDPDEEEVLLLQVPKSFDVEALVGKKVNLEKKTKLGEESGSGKSFEIIQRKAQDLPRQVVTQVASNGQHVLTTVDPVGMLVVREAVKDTDFGEGLEDFLNEFDEAENGVILLPTDIKVRHPLLGADYKKELASRAEALSCLSRLIKEEKQSPKKAKKRKAPKEVPKQEEEDEEEEFKPKPEKKRKKKNMETTADLQWLTNI